MSQDDAHYHNHQNAPKGLILHILPLTVILKHPVDTVKQKREYTAIYSQSTSEWSNIISLTEFERQRKTRGHEPRCIGELNFGDTGSKCGVKYG